MPSPALLREWATDPCNAQCWGLDAVADEIERLRAEVLKLESHVVDVYNAQEAAQIETKAPLSTEGAAEIVFNERGDVLWAERYVFARIHGKGDDFIRDYKEYVVTHAAITAGKHGGVLVEHVVRLVADRSPSKTNGDPSPPQCDVKCLDHPRCECGRGMP
jgi:hypothetical protein